MKNIVFWDVMQCGSVEVYQHFRGTYCLHHWSKKINQAGSLFNLEDEGSMML
jgi:hypothetical protein